LIVFSLSLGGLFAGWFTPTEAGAVGSIGVLLIAIVEKQMNMDRLKKSLVATTQATGMIMFLVAGAVIFGRFLALSQVSFYLASWASSAPVPPYIILALVFFIYLILGCFIAVLALVLLTVPIFYPVVVGTLGYDPIWFGVMMVLVVAMGVITPPVGINIYVLKGIAKDVPLEVMFSGIWPFLLAQIVCIVLLIMFPQIALFLPNLLR